MKKESGQFHFPPMVQLHLGVALLGVAGLFAKFIDLSAVDIIAYRSVLTAAFLFLLLQVLKTPLKLRSVRDYKVAVILGVLAGVHWVTYFLSIQKTSVAIGMITLFTYPVMTVLVEPLLRKSLPSLKDVAISIFVLFGISLLFPSLWQSHHVMSSDYMWGVILGLFSAVCFAARNIGIQHYFKGYSGSQGMFYQFLVSALIILPFTETSAFDISQNNLELLIILTVFFSAAPHVLFSNAISQISAKTAGMVACLQPLYGILLGFILLAETPSSLTILGGLIILLAAYYETVQKAK